MVSPLELSMFNSVLMPPSTSDSNSDQASLSLRRSMQYHVEPDIMLNEIPMVVFDVETTGLSSENDRIIEIGAIKILDGNVVDQISGLYSTHIPISEVIQKLTGISEDMLEGKPTFEQHLPAFLDFIKGSVLVAHNADFDIGFLKSYCSRAGIDIEWPAFCTLKMAREILADLERKNLDTLAEHYGLQFEARHRSIGDVKVTIEVLKQMLAQESDSLTHWGDLSPFYS